MTIEEQLVDKHNKLRTAFEEYGHLVSVYRDEADKLGICGVIVIGCMGYRTVGGVGFDDAISSLISSGLADNSEFRDTINNALDHFMKYND
jgi:hypothetical protein